MVILQIIASTVSLMLDAVMLAMIVRALLPLFVNPEESRVYLFVSLITEPIVVPVRAIMHAFNILQGSPVDWAFTITYFLLMFIRMLLPAI